jgi:ferritin-like metal-binding protein YciE
MRLQMFNELYRTELLELRDAEKQLVRILPQMARASTNADLRELFTRHAEETKDHLGRLEQILTRLHARSLLCKSKAMNGLLAQTRTMLKRESVDSEYTDALLISVAQKVEAHEVACYGCLHVQARFLGYRADLAPLEKSFEDEKRMEEGLRKLAQQVKFTDEMEMERVPMVELAA